MEDVANTVHPFGHRPVVEHLARARHDREVEDGAATRTGPDQRSNTPPCREESSAQVGPDDPVRAGDLRIHARFRAGAIGSIPRWAAAQAAPASMASPFRPEPFMSLIRRAARSRPTARPSSIRKMAGVSASPATTGSDCDALTKAGTGWPGKWVK